MPQWGNQDYKKAVFEQLSKGSAAGATTRTTSSTSTTSRPGAPRRDVEAGVGEAFHPETALLRQIEPQFRAAAAEDAAAGAVGDRPGPAGRAPPARAAPRPGSRRCSASARPTRAQASPDDVAKLAEYSRQNHPEVFQRVMADKPFLVRWLSKPLVAALVGVIAGKLLNRAYDR